MGFLLQNRSKHESIHRHIYRHECGLVAIVLRVMEPRREMNIGCLFAALVILSIAWLAGWRPNEQPIRARKRFDGTCGDTTDTLTPYDRITTAEHDGAGEQGAYIVWSDDGNYEESTK